MTKMTKKQLQRGNNFHSKQRWWLLLVVAILCITPIMAEELLTFDNVKVYDDLTQTVTIVNTFNLGRDISTIKLNTPLVYVVPAGYQKVAEFEIDLFDDTYTDAFEKMVFINNLDGRLIERQFDYKVWGKEEYIVDDYTKVCDKDLICSYILSGNHTEERNAWVDFDTKTLTKGKYIIGIFTQVNIGDNVEWIPTLFGKEIDEWASYIQSSGTQTFIDIGGVNYTVQTFTSNGYFNVTDITLNVSILLVAGGGGGGGDAALGTYISTGGGGAGGLIWDNEFDVAAGNYNIFVGTGGAGKSGTAFRGDIGGNSSAFGLVAVGGGGGGAASGGAGTEREGGDGGSGGGGGHDSGAGLGGDGIAGQGYAGGDGFQAYGGGGGGGASQVGTNGGNNFGGSGGNGTIYNINGTATRFAGGGAGAPASGGTVGTAGNGGGGAVNTQGVDGLGGGGGAGADGGDGVIIIRYLTSDAIAGLPIVNLNTPIDIANFTTNDVDFGGVVYDYSNDIINVSLIINDFYNETNTSGINNSNYTFTKIMADGDYTWNYEACNNISLCTNATARSFTIDATYPALKVIYPNETITFHELSTNLSLNWSANDSNIDSCWYNWNGTNVSVTCSDNTTNILINDGMNKNLTFYVNDTFGQLNSSFVTWNYRLFFNSETYDSEVFEGLSSIFSINLLTNGSDITAANLSYNSTNYLGTISNHGSNNFTLTRTVTAPVVEADTNKTFYWNITQGTLNYNLTGKNQTVINLVIDNCTTNTIVLYNFTIRNEENLTKLSSATTTARINLQIYGFATTTLIQDYTNIYNHINPFAVCLNSSLSTGGTFSNDVQVQYEATGYVSELYHIQNETITSTDFNQNISLYDLNETDSQVFKIIFRDSSFLPVENALIKIYRKYVDEGLYRIVEIPKTDKRGETIAHLVLNEVVYKLEVVKYGTILETFTDVLAVCQTPLVASCEIDLNAFSESITVPDFEDAEDFSFTLGYDNDTRIVSSIFSIPSGSVQTISLNVTREDSLGTAVCTDSLLSSSGTLSCVVPTSFGNSTIIAKIYKEGVLQAQGQISLSQTPFGIYGVNLVFLALFVIITLIGAGMSDNPIYTTIFLLVGVALLFALNLVANNGFIGATATILFLVVAVILVIIKGSRRN